MIIHSGRIGCYSRCMSRYMDKQPHAKPSSANTKHDRNLDWVELQSKKQMKVGFALCFIHT